MSRDQLFLLSPGVRTLFLEAMPVLFSQGSGSAFLAVAMHRPRRRIEQAVQRMEMSGRADELGAAYDGLEQLVARFASLWDDPRYGGGGDGDSASEASSVADAAGHVSHASSCQLAAKEAFEYTSRGVALITLLSGAGAASHGKEVSLLLRQGSLNDDMVRYFFTFPILASGPFLEMAMAGDARALVVLFHFYHAARVWLTGDEYWWARARSRVLEGLILRELESRGLGVCLG
jgi:hypothetical protein